MGDAIPNVRYDTAIPSRWSLVPWSRTNELPMRTTEGCWMGRSEGCRMVHVRTRLSNTSGTCGVSVTGDWSAVDREPSLKLGRCWRGAAAGALREVAAGIELRVKGTAHLKQHSYQMAIFSSGMKIFKIAFQHVVDNSCMVHIAPFSATNFSHMTLF